MAMYKCEHCVSRHRGCVLCLFPALRSFAFLESHTGLSLTFVITSSIASYLKPSPTLFRLALEKQSFGLSPIEHLTALIYTLSQAQGVPAA